MKLSITSGIATAALSIVACFATPAGAADLRDIFSRGSDGGHQNFIRRHEDAGHAGPCYFRADTGYSFSRDPEARWAVTDGTGNLIGDAVGSEDLDNTWFAEAGAGCAAGSTGLRADFMLGVHAERDFQGEPTPVPAAPVDPMHFKLRTYTAMLNLYKDLGNHNGFTPYVGAGIGAAYHRMSEVYFTGNPALVNRIRGNSDLSFVWSLMAGVGYQVSERSILDLGYRFIDMGSISSGRVDSAGFANPAVHVDDIKAHEIKIGLRYHFGGHDDEEDNDSYK